MRKPALAMVESRVREALIALSLAEGYDWELRDSDGLSCYSVLLFRFDAQLPLEVLLALSKSLVGLNWKLIVAREKLVAGKPEALVEVGPGMLMAFSSDQALRDLVQTANEALLAQGY